MRMMRTRLVGAALLAAVASAVGCEEEKLEVVKTGHSRSGAAADVAGQCERRLANAADVLEPGELDRTTEAETAARLLSLYLNEEACTGVPPGPLPLDAAAEAAAEAVLGGDGPAFVADRRVDAAGAPGSCRPGCSTRPPPAPSPETPPATPRRPPSG